MNSESSRCSLSESISDRYGEDSEDGGTYIMKRKRAKMIDDIDL
jgi:hypothetical protein